MDNPCVTKLLESDMAKEHANRQGQTDYPESHNDKKQVANSPFCQACGVEKIAFGVLMHRGSNDHCCNVKPKESFADTAARCYNLDGSGEGTTILRSTR